MSRKTNTPAKREVCWTAKGEECLAHTERGTHLEGEAVETEIADLAIERGWAVEMGEALPERSPKPTEREKIKDAE